MTAASEYQVIEIGKVHESKHNPRQHYDGPALEQLAESIKAVGIITPLLVRPNGKGFELAAGHRRYRAAKLVGLEELPCTVREMSDQVFMEVLTIENLQREDVHPLDEATGYEALMAAPYRMDVHKIAARVGKSVKYIYDRVKLLALSPPAQQFFWDGKIEAGHAILLARLSTDEQARVIGTKTRDFSDGGLFQPCRGLYDEEGGYDDSEIKSCSVRELEDYIKRHIRFNAKKADAFLYPETVAQVAAATRDKRKIIEITHEYLASDQVRQAGDARVYGERAWKRADGKEQSKTCERSVLGVIASGPGHGEAFQVCINKERCEIHWGAEIKAREKRAKQTPAQRVASTQKETAAAKKQQDAYQLREEKRKVWEKHQDRILAAVVERVKKMDAKPTGYLAGLVVEHMRVGRGVAGLTRGKSHEDLIRYMGACVLSERIDDWNAYEEFPKTAKYLGVDLSKIFPAAVPLAAVQPKEKKTAKAKAKKKKKGKSR